MTLMTALYGQNPVTKVQTQHENTENEKIRRFGLVWIVSIWGVLILIWD